MTRNLVEPSSLARTIYGEMKQALGSDEIVKTYIGEVISVWNVRFKDTLGNAFPDINPEQVYQAACYLYENLDTVSKEYVHESAPN